MSRWIAIVKCATVEPNWRPVNPSLEAAAIARRSTEQRRPAPLFNNVEGTKPGFRLAGALGALSSDSRHPLARVALSLGLSHDTAAKELVEHFAQAHQKPAIPPRLISRGPKQNRPARSSRQLSRFWYQIKSR